MMSPALTLFLTALAMFAFAGNSLLCRMALKHTALDPASFTSIRILSGALALWLITGGRGNLRCIAGSWPSAWALFAYAVCFSFAYVSLPASAGALLLFGAVQATMVGYGLWTGERLTMKQVAGLICAFGGLIGLLLPGLSAPPFLESVLMLGAGVAWGIYSLRGKGKDDPACETTGNFMRAAPLAILLSLVTIRWNSLDISGVWYAVFSGSLASGLGYVVWYGALRGLKATSAASVQLSVPVIAAVGGILFLDEIITLRLLFASAAILGGIALVMVDRYKP